MVFPSDASESQRAWKNSFEQKVWIRCKYLGKLTSKSQNEKERTLLKNEQRELAKLVKEVKRGVIKPSNAELRWESHDFNQFDLSDRNIQLISSEFSDSVHEFAKAFNKPVLELFSKSQREKIDEELVAKSRKAFDKLVQSLEQSITPQERKRYSELITEGYAATTKESLKNWLTKAYRFFNWTPSKGTIAAQYLSIELRKLHALEDNGPFKRIFEQANVDSRRLKRLFDTADDNLRLLIAGSKSIQDKGNYDYRYKRCFDSIKEIKEILRAAYLIEMERFQRSQEGTYQDYRSQIVGRDRSNIVTETVTQDKPKTKRRPNLALPKKPNVPNECREHAGRLLDMFVDLRVIRNHLEKAIKHGIKGLETILLPFEKALQSFAKVYQEADALKSEGIKEWKSKSDQLLVEGVTLLRSAEKPLKGVKSENEALLDLRKRAFTKK